MLQLTLNIIVLCVVGFTSLATIAKPFKIDKPNIILVMADDQGWGDTGYNAHPFLKTPELDKMAKGNLVLDRFYAGSPVCSPTRASVMTGRTAFRTKVTNHGRYMRPHEETLAEVLKKHSYVSGIFGKVHMGSGQIDSPCNPTAMGFDEWIIGLNFFDKNPYLSHNGTIEQRKGQGSVIITDDAIEFLNKHKNGTKPIFMVLWYPSPHSPHKEFPDQLKPYKGMKLAGYYNEIALLDQQLGRLRSEIKTLGLAENTILWFCSDNGGLVKESSGGRMKKGSVYEGGLRVPSIIEWPKGELNGKISVPMSTNDIFPTVLSMVGIKHTPKHQLDGEDTSQILLGKQNKRLRPIGFWHGLQEGQSTWNDKILKAIMDKQKLNASLPHDPDRIKKDVDEFPQFPENTSKGHAAWNDWPWKLHRINGKQYELYNLEHDPMETTDLSKDPQFKSRFSNMSEDLNQWMRSVIRSLNGEDYK
ncbi:sulfatase-like hydrolase/transferase [Lentisphaera marina]|uniref:sulfatase-like hydrolase/transferase n=1 Tax=Lentisphaera marina TaxID=1111041 RepID=UPI0023664954|nr:sulfatase-like hydrolase/transferase [Lentisphaera marina]MDD7987023.1 sulfatase-like hydrolase/transferase [Lentisphaera marina]